ncbi:MAG: glycosyltransferase [Terriglobia bacterium]
MSGSGGTLTDSPLVSFVVLCYKTEQYVGDCIESILRIKTDVPFEIVALDDHSPDNTFGVLSSFTDPRLRVIRNDENMGHARSIGVAFRAARGKYVARIDSDDRYRPEFLDRTLPIFEKYPDVGMVYADASLIGPTGIQTAPNSDTHHKGQDFKGCELIELLELNFICAPTIIARRDCFLRLLPVPEHLAFHDWYFTVGISREMEFYYINSVLADYRVHPGNMHARTVLDKTEERSIFWFLDHVYSTPERLPELEARKMRGKKRIYGRHYVTYGDKYFGASMNADARRCYIQALKWQPGFLRSPGFLRRLGATLVGRSRYEKAKALARGLSARSRAVKAA